MSDKAIEAAARAIEDGQRIANPMAVFPERYRHAAGSPMELARAAITAYEEEQERPRKQLEEEVSGYEADFERWNRERDQLQEALREGLPGNGRETYWLRRTEELKAENERLRERVKELEDDVQTESVCADRAVAKVETEMKRLQEALRDLLKGLDWHDKELSQIGQGDILWEDIAKARAALTNPEEE